MLTDLKTPRAHADCLMQNIRILLKVDNQVARVGRSSTLPRGTADGGFGSEDGGRTRKEYTAIRRFRPTLSLRFSLQLAFIM